MDKFIAVLKVIDKLDDQALLILRATIASGTVPAALKPYVAELEQVLLFFQKIEEILAGFGLLKTPPKFVGGGGGINPNA